MIKFQINDCGILLATSPASWRFKGISDDATQRISVALGFRYMIPPVAHALYAPEHHKEMIAKLFGNLGVSPDFVVPSAELQSTAGVETRIDSGVNELEGCAEIFVESCGPDAVRQIRKILRGYCVDHVAAINLFLKLTDPVTYRMTAEFEKLGFFFAGILPESKIGDALILQYLNNVSLDYSKILLVSDIAKELLTYISERDPNIID
jgi:serine/threonine-protein kinase RsbW